jgi:predicted GIY-YIG superfamily endonuclease
MIDYNETKMYMFRHKEDIENRNIYIGYTTDWNKRLICHKNKYNKNHKYLIYQYIRQNGGWDEWEMKWIEDYPCISKHEAMLRERELMCEYNSTLNVCKNLIMSDAEKKEYMKNYERDKEKKAIMDKEYREKQEKITCECGFKLFRRHLTEHIKTKKHIILIKK